MRILHCVLQKMVPRCTYPYLVQILHSPLHMCQRFSIFCRHMSKKKDKPTTLNTFATVGVWNGTIIYFAEPIPISPKFRTLPYICVNDLAFFVGT